MVHLHHGLDSAVIRIYLDHFYHGSARGPLFTTDLTFLILDDPAFLLTIPRRGKARFFTIWQDGSLLFPRQGRWDDSSRSDRACSPIRQVWAHSDSSRSGMASLIPAIIPTILIPTCLVYPSAVRAIPFYSSSIHLYPSPWMGEGFLSCLFPFIPFLFSLLFRLYPLYSTRFWLFLSIPDLFCYSLLSLV